MTRLVELTTFVGVCVMSGSIAVASTSQGFGPQAYRSQTIDADVNAVGPVGVDSSTFKKSVHVRGPVGFDHSSVEGKLIVEGPLGADSSKFFGNVDVTGPIGANDCEFRSDVKGLARLSFTNSKVQGKVSVAASSSKEPSIVCLDKSTQLAGVEFLNIKGTVYLVDGKSTIKGNVDNGSTLKGPCPR